MHKTFPVDCRNRVFPYNFHFIQFLLQDGQFRIRNDLILSYPYVKYFIDFNTKRGICRAFVVLNL